MLPIDYLNSISLQATWWFWMDCVLTVDSFFNFKICRIFFDKNQCIPNRFELSSTKCIPDESTCTVLATDTVESLRCSDFRRLDHCCRQVQKHPTVARDRWLKVLCSKSYTNKTCLRNLTESKIINITLVSCLRINNWHINKLTNMLIVR